jgi:hypothetical protein
MLSKLVMAMDQYFMTRHVSMERMIDALVESVLPW